MPTYGYRCTACGHTFERVQKFTDPAITECETCGAPVKKLLYPVGIAFKGSGFYVNDSAPKRSEAAKSEGSEAGSKTESAPDSGAKTETKPDAPKTDTATPTPAPAADSKPASKTDTAAASS